jgi:hypothetical protein
MSMEHMGTRMKKRSVIRRSSKLHKSADEKRERTPEGVPDAMLVLCIRAAVVDHNVCHWHHAGLLERLDQRLQLLLVPVVAVQVVQLPWEVPLQAVSTGQGRTSSKGFLERLEQRLLFCQARSYSITTDTAAVTCSHKGA